MNCYGVALTKRARILVYDKNRNPDYKINSYTDLGQDILTIDKNVNY